MAVGSEPCTGSIPKGVLETICLCGHGSLVACGPVDPFGGRDRSSCGVAQPLLKREALGGRINSVPVAVTGDGEGARAEPTGGRNLAAGESWEARDPAQRLIYFCRDAFQGRDVPNQRQQELRDSRPPGLANGPRSEWPSCSAPSSRRRGLAAGARRGCN